jgi:ferredoxin/flavodoxin---NADP+ reductase
VQDLWQGGVLERWGFAPAPENTHVFLCGSPAMIDGTVALLGARRFQGAHEEGSRANSRRN